jgi:tetratricopeptide (TPR) repeat protein
LNHSTLSTDFPKPRGPFARICLKTNLTTNAFLMKSLALISVLFFASGLQAQTLRAYERAGDNAFQRKDYGAAVQYYGDVLKRHDDDLSLWWKYGESARLFQAFPEAEKSYKKVSTSPEYREAHPLLEYRLGEVKKSQGDYAAAIAHFERFLAEKPRAERAFFEKAQAEIEACRAAQAIAAVPVQVEMKHLGREINSPYSEFAPIVVGDTLYYSSYRFDQKVEKGQEKRKLSKVMISSKGGRGREPGRGFPVADTAHIAHTAFSPDGHYVFFTVCNNLNVNDIRCELWLTVIDRRNRWLPPVPLPEPVNMPGYTTTQPSIAYDEAAQGPVLWFASDRPGGAGKMDLWYLPLDTNYFCACNLPLPGKKIGALPRFSQPVNAAALNTSENEATPFYFSPAQKLFFSSEGLPGLGGYDVFFADKSEWSFATPQNAGAGLNTSYNDLYLYLKNDGKNGYLSSNRPGSFFLDDKNKACCNDIFSFKLPQAVEAAKREIPEIRDTVAILVKKEPIIAPAPLPVEPLTVAPPRLKDFEGLPLYFDNDEPDPRTRRSTTKKAYEETARAYLERQAEYRTQFAAGLADVAADEAETRVDDFFESEVRRGLDRLDQLCALLLERLEGGESIEVVIKGFTSPRAESAYNLQLGKRRIHSVRNQFEFFAEGALLSYLQNGQLRLAEANFGETAARMGISDRLDDQRNSVYHPDAARERRVEIVEIRQKK